MKESPSENLSDNLADNSPSENLIDDFDKDDLLDLLKLNQQTANPAEIKINSGPKRFAFFTSFFLYISIISLSFVPHGR